MDTRETVNELLRRIAVGDPTEVAALYAEQISWKLNWPDDDYADTVPWIRQRSTRAGVAQHYALIAEHHIAELSSAEVHSVLVDGADAVVFGELHNTAAPTGRSYTAAFALHLTVVDGLITRHHIYEDSLSVFRAFTD
ncbi:nuclear transport factor 2 family protein [Mycobacterium sp. NPDC003323]